MSKRLLRSPAAQRALGGAIGGYMRLCDLATRWETVGRSHVDPFLQEGRPAIIAIWHGRLMQMSRCWPKAAAARAGHVLISQSRDGEVVAAATARLGYSVIRGSSHKAGKAKGGFAALREMLARLEAGETVALTPDGPKGPRMRASLGVVQLARLSGAPILPFAWAKRAAFVAESWDRFVVPLPFGYGVSGWGAPIVVDRAASAEAMERARAQVEDELNRLTAAMDARVGRARTEPAPLPAAAVAAPWPS